MSKKNDAGPQESDVQGAPRMVVVTAAEARRRAGHRFAKGENRVEADAFTEEKWREIAADPVLSIRPFED